jgi:uncharacterized membrane-anchored protein
MINKGKIKVVKKLEIRKVTPKVKPVKSSRIAAREMVSTVTEWVSELKLRKSGETKAALDLLFGTNSRPSES